MGAEGGVCWIYLNGGATVGEVQRTFQPWWEALTHIGSSDKDSTRDQYIWSDIDLTNCVLGPYGDDGHDLSWRGLEAWVEHIRFITTDPTYGLSDATFSDLWMEIETRPTWLGCHSWLVQEWIDELGSFCKPNTHRVTDAERESFMNLPLKVWLQEVDRLFGTHIHAHSVETWT